MHSDKHIFLPGHYLKETSITKSDIRNESDQQVKMFPSTVHKYNTHQYQTVISLTEYKPPRKRINHQKYAMP
jgi:hypothetical protein